MLISLLVGSSHDLLVHRLKANSTRISQMSSVLLMGVGLFTILTVIYQPRFVVVGNGPLGYQPDVFDSVPGDPDYNPLRKLYLVHWQEDSAVRELASTGEIEAAAAGPGQDRQVDYDRGLLNRDLTLGGSR